MDLQLNGKTALVVAASKGIGFAAAEALAREGCRVIITSSNTDNLRRAREALASPHRGRVMALVMDVRSPDAIRASAERVLAEHERVDILVTNGPGPKPTEAIATSQEDFTGALQANLLSGVQLCTAFLPGMVAAGFGRIIHLTSSTGKEPDEGMVLSNVARAGVLAYAKTLAREVARHGVTVNAILTGSVMTERTVDLLQRDARAGGISYEEVVRQAEKSIPAGYIASPELFCHMIAFLASPLAAYVNGVSLPIDGGYMRAI